MYSFFHEKNLYLLLQDEIKIYITEPHSSFARFEIVCQPKLKQHNAIFLKRIHIIAKMSTDYHGAFYKETAQTLNIT